MYIAIITKDHNVSDLISESIDQIITSNHIQHMELYAFGGFSLDLIVNITNRLSGYYFLVDIVSYPNYEHVYQKLHQIFPNAIIGIISNNNADAATLLNSQLSLYGYLNINHSNQRIILTSILVNLNSTFFCYKKRVVIRENGILHFIDLHDIYYIDKWKGTHNCIVCHSNGFCNFRGNIKDIYEKLTCYDDGNFQIVRSSTIANLKSAISIEPVSRIINFPQNTSCNYSQAYYSGILQHSDEVFTHS